MDAFQAIILAVFSETRDLFSLVCVLVFLSLLDSRSSKNTLAVGRCAGPFCLFRLICTYSCHFGNPAAGLRNSNSLIRLEGEPVL